MPEEYFLTLVEPRVTPAARPWASGLPLEDGQALTRARLAQLELCRRCADGAKLGDRYNEADVSHVGLAHRYSL